MQCPEVPFELPASTPHLSQPESPTPRWELDAALAVLARAHEEWAALAHADANLQMRQAAARRLQSAQQLVTRIQGKLGAAQSQPHSLDSAALTIP